MFGRDETWKEGKRWTDFAVKIENCSFGLSDFWKERKIREKKSLSGPTPFIL